MFFKNNLIYKSISRSLAILPKSFRKRSVFLFLGILTNSFFDLLGLAAILPLLASILKEGFIHENKYLSGLYNGLGFNTDNLFIVFLCALILSFIVIKNLFGLWVQKTQIKFSWDTYENLSTDVLKSAYQKGFLFFTSENSNRLLNRIVNVPNRYSQLFLLQLFLFLNELVILIMVIVSLVIYDYKILLLLSAVVLPIFMIFYKLTKNRVGYYNSRLDELIPKISKPVFEIVFGFVDIAIGQVFKNFNDEYAKGVKESKILKTRLGIVTQIPNRLVETCVILAVILMLLYGVFVLSSVDKIVSLLSIFGLAAYRTIPSINRLMVSIVNIKGQEFNLDLLEKFLPIKKDNNQSEEILFTDKILLEKISFTYPDSKTPVLKNFSIEIKKGESIGLKGKSGSGKTTLMNILLGFLEPSRGNVFIDDKLLNKNTVDSWHRKIGYVRQDVFLVDGSLKENIALGIPKNQIDLNKLNSVIDRAQLKSVVQSLSHGIETNIGERGAKISGGQRQRIGIARALYHDAEVLFFDEATSALDSETEEEITEAIKSLHNENLTMIIIAHRESTLRYCDKIISI